MNQYTESPTSRTDLTNDMQNLITLREDLHSIFDQRFFVFVPKGSAFYVHFLLPTVDLGPIYHNREVRNLASIVTPELIFAQFAWAIFYHSQEFSTRPRVAITVWNEDVEEWQRQTKDGKQWYDDQDKIRKHARAEEKGKGKATAADGACDQDANPHPDPGSQPRDSSTPNPTNDSSLGSPMPGTPRSAGGSATRATATAISPGAIAEIIRLSRVHPEIMSYLSEHHPEGLASGVQRFEIASRVIRRCNISIRKDDSPRTNQPSSYLLANIAQGKSCIRGRAEVGTRAPNLRSWSKRDIGRWGAVDTPIAGRWSLGLAVSKFPNRPGLKAPELPVHKTVLDEFCRSVANSRDTVSLVIYPVYSTSMVTTRQNPCQLD